MKVIHINISDTNGGASIAAYRHCEAMRAAGIDASMLVIQKNKKSSFHTFCVGNEKYSKIRLSFITKWMLLFLKPFKPWGIFSYPFWGISIAKHPAVKEADLIYLHWIAGSILSTKEVEKIFKLGKPVRWYMHDMNPITGGCHHSMDCIQYQTECKRCPLLKSHPLGIDLAHMQFKKRMKHWNKYKNLEAYTPSEWLGKCVKQSALWKGHKVTVFPNVLDTKKFHPADKQAARNILTINSTRKLILFGAVGIDSPYKGWEYMRNALNELNPQTYEALIFGEENEQVKKDLIIPCNFIGYLHDEYSLILAYNAADVFVSASLAENYPNVILEAMSCGVPCVGFNVGGIPEQIQHKTNGYLATLKDSASLANGIRYVCESTKENYNSMCAAARAFACKVTSYNAYNNFQ